MQIKHTQSFAFDNSYARLPDGFFARVAPTPAKDPILLRLNIELARKLGLAPDWLATDEGVKNLTGIEIPEGADPIAMAYAGHQFGNFVPQLGDGRAILLGEVRDDENIRRDIQLKGSGKTPYSRGGDGRAAIGPVLREYIVSEAMAALGVPTTRALAAFATGDDIMREGPEPGAMLIRVAKSHIRIGTFQFFAARNDKTALAQLADYAINRLYPELADAKNRYLALFEAVIKAQAELVAKWQSIGFIHGVMNTDNMSIAGETIDYGPCAFMDYFDPTMVYSSIDQRGRYAYNNQPPIAQWNLIRLAEALLPLFSDDKDKAVELAQKAINGFPALFEAAYLRAMRAKLGLTTLQDNDLALAQDLLTIMANGNADFTLTFRYLADLVSVDIEQHPQLTALFEDAEPFWQWVTRWRQRLAEEPEAAPERHAAMHTTNPVYIPRNHLIAEAITAAQNEQDYAPFNDLVEVLANPFEEQTGKERYALPPTREQVVHQTFCGT